MTTSTNWPDGWCVEVGDSSVGIFGEFYWHDACKVGTDVTEPEADYSEVASEPEGEGVNRFRTITATMTCKSCSESASFTYKEWTPEYPDS